MLADLLRSWVLTAAACVLITAVFAIAFHELANGLRWVKERNEQIHRELAGSADRDEPQAGRVPRAVRDQLVDCRNETRPEMRRRKIREWQLDAARLAASVAFWVDLLRQLGLLGTVLGLGLSLSLGGTRADDLLQPLSLAVWTTVVGLFLSIILSWRYAKEVEIEADDAVKNLEAWEQQLAAPARRTAEA